MRIIGNDPNTPRQTQVVASGTLSTGDTVVVNSDGTVSAVSSTSVPEDIGSATVYKSGNAPNKDMVYDSASQKVIIAYREFTSGDGKAIVGTVSGTSISFGSETTFDSGQAEDIRIVYDSVNQKVVIGWKAVGNSNYGTAIVGTVSGTSISFGTATVFYSSGLSNFGFGYNASDAKILAVYRDSSNLDGRYVLT